MVELEGRAVSGYFEDAGRRVLAGQALGRDEAMELGRRVGALPAQGGEAARALLDAARQVKEHHFGRRVGLCSIVNARSGSCSENCAFCAQSAHHHARRRGACREYPFIGLEAIVRAARAAREAGATRFGIVTSGKALGGADFQELLRAVAAVRGLGLFADASVGILPRRSLEALRDAGSGPTTTTWKPRAASSGASAPPTPTTTTWTPCATPWTWGCMSVPAGCSAWARVGSTVWSWPWNCAPWACPPCP